MLFLSLTGLFMGCCLTGTGLGQDAQDSFGIEHTIRVPQIQEDILMLSSTQFQGRQTGTPGGEQAATFVAQRFQSLGLLPPAERVQALRDGTFTQWKQSLPITASRVIGPAHLTFFPIGQSGHTPMVTRPGKDFLPFLDSPSVNLTAPVVFVGFGIVDPARGVDDYHRIDVHNRIVMALRGKPPTYGPWITQEEKSQMAKDQGAAGFMTLTGPILNRYEARKGLGTGPRAIYAAGLEAEPLPAVWLDGKVGEDLFQSIGLSLHRMQSAHNENPTLGPQALPLVAHLQWSTHSMPGRLINIVGILPGQDTGQLKEVIIIGAHRDHFGEQAGIEFPGADDNASGTAVLLALANVLTQRDPPLSCTIVFVSFDGEERGLLGSRFYVDHPLFPLQRTRAMINIDHVGIGNGKLTVGITRQEKALVHLAAEQAGLADQIEVYGYFPGGDHVPFFEAGVPTVTIVSSGVHPHFHQPSDTAETIQPEILETTTTFLLSLISRLADNPQLSTQR